MHDVTKFYTTLLLGLITASIALVSLGAGTSTTSMSKTLQPIKLEWLGILWLGFVTVGFLELHYFMELRIRKIKMVDRIVAIRELFSNIASDLVKGLLQDKLLFITGIRQSPPYLRRPSGEWYLILYICALNATALVFSIWALALFPGWPGWIAVLGGGIAFVLQYWSITARAYHEDLRRAKNYGPSNYSYLSHGDVALVFKPFNFLAHCCEMYLSWKGTP
jgi:hypothetical protein